MSSSPGVSCMDAGVDRLHQNFRFGPVFCASYSSPAPDTTNLQPEQTPRDRQSPLTGSFRLTGPVSRVKSREIGFSECGFLPHDGALDQISIMRLSGPMVVEWNWNAALPRRPASPARCLIGKLIRTSEECRFDLALHSRGTPLCRHVVVCPPKRCTTLPLVVKHQSGVGCCCISAIPPFHRCR